MIDINVTNPRTLHRLIDDADSVCISRRNKYGQKRLTDVEHDKAHNIGHAIIMKTGSCRLAIEGKTLAIV